MAKGTLEVGGKMASLEIEQGSSGGVAGALIVDNDDVDKQAIVVEASNTTADVADITADAVTTAKVIDITADALTSGSVLYIDSDSSDTTARNVVDIINNHASATGAIPLNVRQDSSGAAAIFEGGQVYVRKGSALQTNLTAGLVCGD